MNPTLQKLMTEATNLTRSGNLAEATAKIQQALAGAMSHVNSPQPSNDASLASVVIDVEARDVTAGATQGQTISDAEPVGAPPPRSAPPRRASNSGVTEFIAGSHAKGSMQRDYKLFIPADAQAGTGEKLLPLVVMLHGCTQAPDDFASGTAMNELAAQHGFLVLYPAQSKKANPQGCWNWFKHTHQQRGRGEPDVIADMTRAVMAKYPIDPRRVYVAGLSAGGAMAAILGAAYPDLYAAIGVHSGLAASSATDLPAALAAMRSGAPGGAAASQGMPTIVFHGDSDSTVHPANGESVIASSIAGGSAVETQKVEAAGVRPATRYVHTEKSTGRVLAEHWVVHGAPHAWSGGSSRGTYTDPRGPDASSEMIRFFLEHPKPQPQ